MKTFATILLVCLVSACRPAPVPNSSGSGGVTNTQDLVGTKPATNGVEVELSSEYIRLIREDALKVELVAAGITPHLPDFGFIRFRRAGELAQGLSQSELIAYADSYGVFDIDAPATIPIGKLDRWATEFNRIRVEKHQKAEEDAKGQPPAGGDGKPAPGR